MEKSGRAKRVTKWFTVLAEAEKHQRETNEQLLAEGATGIAFDASLRVDASAARQHLNTLGYFHVSLLQLARAHTESSPQAGPPKLIAPMLEAFLTEKEEAEGASPQTIQNLKTRIKGWIDREKLNSVDEVRRERVEGLRIRPGIGAHGRKNDMAAVSSFCTYLLEKGQIAVHPLKGIRRPKIPPGPKAIFTPEECGRVLEAARVHTKGRWLGTIAVMLFVGNRPSELAETRLTYGRGAVARIEGGKLKGRANRLVQLIPAAAAWLKVAGQPTQVKPINQKARNCICALAGVKYSTDVLRHSFISYRLALLKDTAAVAIEAGNSEAEIFRSYHRPIPAGDARKWASLRPAVKSA